ncbi:hypothetical protein O6P43_027198 [Quillaja saponaria]|uniref:Uncharacterized protein n=1 Tax=Quillaja saponaria TaxID=32244 RepID=A0AAD7PD12_QUISA|nr:hypothetical protein O6P43_027198 [Quillaja saponaria]
MKISSSILRGTRIDIAEIVARDPEIRAIAAANLETFAVMKKVRENGRGDIHALEIAVVIQIAITRGGSMKN